MVGEAAPAACSSFVDFAAVGPWHLAPPGHTQVTILCPTSLCLQPPIAAVKATPGRAEEPHSGLTLLWLQESCCGVDTYVVQCLCQFMTESMHGPGPRKVFSNKLWKRPCAGLVNMQTSTIVQTQGIARHHHHNSKCFQHLCLILDAANNLEVRKAASSVGPLVGCMDDCCCKCLP